MAVGNNVPTKDDIEIRTPSTGNARTPDAGNTRTPSTGDTRTPETGNTRTPSSGNVRTPETGNTRTPSTGNVRTPETGSVRTPGTINRTPETGDVRTPSTGEARTPETIKRTPSTGETRTPSSNVENRTPNAGDMDSFKSRVPTREDLFGEEDENSSEKSEATYGTSSSKSESNAEKDAAGSTKSDAEKDAGSSTSKSDISSKDFAKLDGMSADEQQAFMKDYLSQMPPGVQMAAAMDGLGFDMTRLQDDGSYSVSGDAVAYGEGQALGILNDKGDLDMNAATKLLDTPYESFTDEQKSMVDNIACVNSTVMDYVFDENGDSLKGTKEGDALEDFMGNIDEVSDLTDYQSSNWAKQKMTTASIVSDALSNMNTLQNSDLVIDSDTMAQYQAYQTMMDAAKEGSLTPDVAAKSVEGLSATQLIGLGGIAGAAAKDAMDDKSAESTEEKQSFWDKLKDASGFFQDENEKSAEKESDGKNREKTGSSDVKSKNDDQKESDTGANKESDSVTKPSESKDAKESDSNPKAADSKTSDNEDDKSSDSNDRMYGFGPDMENVPGEHGPGMPPPPPVVVINVEGDYNVNGKSMLDIAREQMAELGDVDGNWKQDTEVPSWYNDMQDWMKEQEASKETSTSGQKKSLSDILPDMKFGGDSKDAIQSDSAAKSEKQAETGSRFKQAWEQFSGMLNQKQGMENDGTELE